MSRQEPKRGQPCHGLARSGLADEAKGLALSEREVDTAQNRHAAEGDVEACDLDQRRHGYASKLPARKSIAKAGEAFHLIEFGLAVKVAFWCSTV